MIYNNGILFYFRTYMIWFYIVEVLLIVLLLHTWFGKNNKGGLQVITDQLDTDDKGDKKLRLMLFSMTGIVILYTIFVLTMHIFSLSYSNSLSSNTYQYEDDMDINGVWYYETFGNNIYKRIIVVDNGKVDIIRINNKETFVNTLIMKKQAENSTYYTFIDEYSYAMSYDKDKDEISIYSGSNSSNNAIIGSNTYNDELLITGVYHRLDSKDYWESRDK